MVQHLITITNIIREFHFYNNSFHSNNLENLTNNKQSDRNISLCFTIPIL